MTAAVPLAARREYVEDGVQNLAHIHIARPAAALGRRDHRFKQRPLGVNQITRITQAAAFGRTRCSVFHIGYPSEVIRVPHKESQLILPAEQLSGSALRFAQQWFDESNSR
jgi:hypothetical protein